MQTGPASRQKSSAPTRSVSSKKQSPTEKQSASVSPKGRSSGSKGKDAASTLEDIKQAAESSGKRVRDIDLTAEPKNESAAGSDQNGRLGLPEAEKLASESLATEDDREQQAAIVTAEEADLPADSSTAVRVTEQSQALKVERQTSFQPEDTSAPGSSTPAGGKDTEPATAAPEDPAVAAAQLAEDSRR